MDHKLDKLKKQYAQIPIPEELDSVVSRALSQHTRRRIRTRWISAASAAVLLLVIGINVSASAAQAFAALPVVGPLIKVLTIREYIMKDDRHHADIQVPGISNLDNKGLELGLNEKYLAEGHALYEQFEKDMKAAQQGHFGVDAGYIVMTDTDEIFAIARYVVTSAGSSSEERKYDTIDKKHQILLTLPLLFKDDRYIEAISRNITEQMRQRMNEDPGKTYWVETKEGGVSTETFKRIRPDHSFYINADGQLVISFNKYEVAPGYMGVQEFIIPTEAITDLLLSRNYIK